MENKNVLIAGTGELGKALAYKLLLNGNTVIINSRNEEKLKKIKNDYLKYGNIDYINLELNDETSCKKLIDDTVNKVNSIDSIIIMVGGYVEDTVNTLDGLDEMIKNYIKIPLYLSKHAIKYMKYNSTIIFISNSDTVNKNREDVMSYTVAKSALNKAMNIMAVELMDKGIRVNTVAPEYIIQSFEINRDYRKMRKIGDLETPPEDIANVINFLINGESEWLNGAFIPVDGGHSLK